MKRVARCAFLLTLSAALCWGAVSRLTSVEPNWVEPGDAVVAQGQGLGKGQVWIGRCGRVPGRKVSDLAQGCVEVGELHGIGIGSRFSVNPGRQPVNEDIAAGARERDTAPVSIFKQRHILCCHVAGGGYSQRAFRDLHTVKHDGVCLGDGHITGTGGLHPQRVDICVQCQRTRDRDVQAIGDDGRIRHHRDSAMLPSMFNMISPLPFVHKVRKSRSDGVPPTP